jgi:hypothetical protein
MNMLAIYAFLVLVLLVLAVLAVMTFYRFRYRGDKTMILTVFFFAAFLGDIVLTLVMLNPA